jgi:hypothetical protein
VGQLPSAGVVITNYNYGRFLTASLSSVLNQTCAAQEVIVVDDGSTDESAEVLGRFGSQIRVIRTRNQGQAAALARGIEACRAEVLCLLDADDAWTPDKIACVLPVFAEHARVQWLRHKLVVCDEELRPRAATIPAFTGAALLPPRPLSILERTVTASTSGLVVRKSSALAVFEAIRKDAASNAFFAWDADALLLARLTAQAAWGYSLDAVLGSYRRHGGQQFDAPNDLLRLLERQLAVGRALASVLGAETGAAVVDHKHRLILATLQGRARGHPARVAEALRGAAAGMRALPTDPALAIRQLAALSLAFAAPSAWINRLMRTQGVHGSS